MTLIGQVGAGLCHKAESSLITLIYQYNDKSINVMINSNHALSVSCSVQNAF